MRAMRPSRPLWSLLKKNWQPQAGPSRRVGGVWKRNCGVYLKTTGASSCSKPAKMELRPVFFPDSLLYHLDDPSPSAFSAFCAYSAKDRPTISCAFRAFCAWQRYIAETGNWTGSLRVLEFVVSKDNRPLSPVPSAFGNPDLHPKTNDVA